MVEVFLDTGVVVQFPSGGGEEAQINKSEGLISGQTEKIHA